MIPGICMHWAVLSCIFPVDLRLFFRHSPCVTVFYLGTIFGGEFCKAIFENVFFFFALWGFKFIFVVETLLNITTLFC